MRLLLKDKQILKILQKNKITYKECFEIFKKKYPEDWEYFTEGSSSGDDSSFYDEEGLWDSHKNIHHIEGLSEEKKKTITRFI